MKNLNVLRSPMLCTFFLCAVSVSGVAFSAPQPAPEPVESSQPSEPTPVPQSPVCGDWPYCLIEKS